MSTGPAVTCEGTEWTLVFDGPVDGLFTGSFQALSGRAYMRVALEQPAEDEKGFVVSQEVIPLYVRTDEMVFAKPVNGTSCVVIMG